MPAKDPTLLRAEKEMRDSADAMREKKAELERIKENQRIETELKERKGQREGASEKSKAKRDEAWKKLEEASNRLIEEGQKGYDNWASAMSSLLVHCQLVVNANPMGRLLRGVAGFAAGRIEQETGVELSIGGIGDLMLKKQIKDPKGPISAEEKAAVTLPSLQYFVDFSGDKLDTSSISKNLRRSDGEEFSPEEKQILEKALAAGITAWLKDRGYDADPANPGKFVERGTANHLAAADFERLRADPATGLNAFLNGHFEFQFEEAQTPRL